MTEISNTIGENIRLFRKKRHMTLEQLAQKVCKGKSTLSKYEKGEIVLDVETLYELADVLQVHVSQLLYNPPHKDTIQSEKANSTFFSGVDQFYSYLFDGRTNKLMRCVFDVVSHPEVNQYGIRMYMNFKDYSQYRLCETTYYGYMEHFDSLTNILLTNEDSPIEKASAHILASFQSAEYKWGLFNGISSRPLMPISIKMLFAKTRLDETPELLESLKVSRDDIRFLKLYNMLSVT